MRSICPLVILVLSWVSWLPGADLAFDNPKAKINPKLSENTQSFVFKFKNATDHPVRIVEIKDGCSCFTFKADKESYKPGEKGDITMVYDFEGDSGLMKRKVGIITRRDGRDEDERTDLFFEGEIPTALDWAVRTTVYKFGAKPEVKHVKAAINPKKIAAEKLEVLGIKVDGADQTPHLKVTAEIAPGNKGIDITLTPKSMNKADHLPKGGQYERYIYNVVYTLKPGNVEKRERFTVVFTE